MTRYPHVENAFDPEQPRDARGRWTIGTAVRASRAATEASRATVATPTKKAHTEAKDLHTHASQQHTILSARHARLGNKRASAAFARQSTEHATQARGHADEASRFSDAETSPRKRASVARSVGARRGWEKRKEADDFARANIPHELLPLWEKTKGRFKGSPDKRSEAFLEYAEEHRREASRALVDEADEKLAVLLREYHATEDRKTADEIALEEELDEERAAMREENPMPKRRQRTVNVNPELAPSTYARTYVAELVSEPAGELKKLAEEMRAGADPTKLRARLDANIALLTAVSEGIRSRRPRARQNPEAPPPDYKKAHWGIAPPNGLTRMSIPEPKANTKMVALGQLVSVTYLTKKGGDAGLTEYEHRFKKVLPMLVYGNRNGRLYVAGGTYKVETRGIVG